MKKTIVVIVLSLAVGSAAGAERSSTVIHQFRKLNPCPATGKIERTCPGYVIDHIVPLCAGGPDILENLTYQKTADSYRKDKLERDICRRLRMCVKPAAK